MAVDTAGIEQWDRYWAYGGLHSFSQVTDGNYQGAIAEFWRARFGDLESGMQEAALNEADLHSLERLLKAQGFVTSGCGELREHDGMLLGWYLVGGR